MCDTCGCGITGPEGRALQNKLEHDHHHDHDHHDHDHDHHHEHEHSSRRIVEIKQDVLAKNALYAKNNRELLSERKARAVNLLSSPGAGKTTLLMATIARLKDRLPMAVVEGDLQTDNDARKIESTGVPVHQINTLTACHLDAHMTGHALSKLGPPLGALVFIENVGNLVCPAGFDLGENLTVTILSVTEGDDKPAKYPVAFVHARAMVISKIDLLPHVDFSIEECVRCARAVNPDLEVFQLSARTGQGLDPWCDWIREAR